MTISMIAAMGTNRALGFGNKLPWYIPEDLKRFRALTTGHPIIMGRKTYESIGRPLPNRTNMVVSRNPDLTLEGCEVYPSIEAALEAARAIDQEEIFIIGGGQIYAEGLPYATRMYLTFVEAAPDGDAFFPEYKAHEWEEISSESTQKDEENTYSYTYKVLERK